MSSLVAMAYNTLVAACQNLTSTLLHMTCSKEHGGLDDRLLLQLMVQDRRGFAVP